jgi:hypothetical protein
VSCILINLQEGHELGIRTKKTKFTFYTPMPGTNRTVQCSGESCLTKSLGPLSTYVGASDP